MITVSSSYPPTPKEGDAFYNTSTVSAYIYISGTWHNLGKKPMNYYWVDPKKQVYTGSLEGFVYCTPEGLHCSFGPALVSGTTQEYYIEGTKLTDEQKNIFQSILQNIKLAPTYINHDIFKYPSRFILGYYKIGDQ